jgi:hypothetical protein
MDPRRRGEYQGVQDVSRTLGSMWAPALYTFLAMSWGAEGWLVIAGIVVFATAGMSPSVRLAERFARQHFAPAPVTEAAPPAEEPQPPGGGDPHPTPGGRPLGGPAPQPVDLS